MNNTYREKIKNALNDLKSKKTFYKQIPNLLTTSRILAPFIIIPLMLTGNIIPAVISASIIASTDFFDGLIARKYKITSELGRELDAVSDKIFALALSTPLAILNPLFFINIGFECLIGLENLRAKIMGLNPKTIFIGKVKTFSLSTSIIIGYLNLFFNIDPILKGSLLITFILQFLTTTNYIKTNCKNNLNLLQKKYEKNTKNESENKEKEKVKTKIYEKQNIEYINEKQKVLKFEKKKRL